MRSSDLLDLIVIGAGASGLFLSLLAARRGLSVTVLEHGPATGRKLRASGGGRCNLTNLAAGPEDYFSDNPHFCRSALARFTPAEALAAFAEFGLAFEEKAPGQMFCVQGARRLAEALEAACREAGARIVLNCPVRAVTGPAPFRVETGTGIFEAPRLAVACGGPSWPNLGASDLAFRLARQFGLDVVEPRPALVPLVLSGGQARLCRDLAGLSLTEARVACGGRSFLGGLLFTHRGLSGPAVLEASCLWRPGLEVAVDFLPGRDLEDLLRQGRGEFRGLTKTFLRRLLPDRLVAALAPPGAAERPLAQLSNAELAETARAFQNFTATPSDTEGLAKAEVTAGGVDTRDISSKTMECRKIPGLFFLGEALDVTGRLGGFNLQWAWSSAAAAAASL